MVLKPKLQLSGVKKLSAVVNSAIAQPAVAVRADESIDLGLIDVRPQVRTKVRNLEELAESIKVLGVHTPIIVHAEANGRYRLIAGERRYRASLLAGLTEIPAVIKRGLSEREIRRIQVSENNDRDGITPYEQAMGVIQDVETYGVEEAQAIWNRSEPWISKRVSVKGYDAKIVQLMDDELTGDLELLQALNQIVKLKPDDFPILEAKLRDGQLTRDEARTKLAGIKSWKAEQEQIASRRQQIAPRAAAPVPADDEQSSAQASRQNPADEQTSDDVAPGDAGSSSSPPTPGSLRVERSAARQGGSTSTDDDQVKYNFQQRLLEVFEQGKVARELCRAVKVGTANLNCTKDETDWALWSTFLTMALPVLQECGAERSTSMLKRLQAELKQSSPSELWKSLHPGGEQGQEPQPIAVMPADWRL